MREMLEPWATEWHLDKKETGAKVGEWEAVMQAVCIDGEDRQATYEYGDIRRKGGSVHSRHDYNDTDC